MTFLRIALTVVLAAVVTLRAAETASRPNIVLVMADDMGWGETSYNRHPVLKTPHLDALAASGLRFDRFYAGAPNCSPTRATVMTGRTNDRGGVQNHGFALRRQEKVLPRALRDAGYVTGHFGKWHLNGYSGPGAPILATDDHNPGEFGFDEWLSVTNFFDRDPILSRKGKIEEFKGDSSEIIVGEALKFMAKNRSGGKPLFAVVWYGSPHSPYIASAADKQALGGLNEPSQNHYGELVALDRSVGTLRKGLRELGIADNTLLWFCSDNGGLPDVKPDTVGGLRGFKGSVYEGGLRVPCVIEWPAVIKTARITQYPAGTMDIFPTIADILGLPASVMLKPVDGSSIKPLLTAEVPQRSKPIGFRHTNRAALVDNWHKIVWPKVGTDTFELYDLKADPKEARNLVTEQPEVARRMQQAIRQWNDSVNASVAGKDYPEGRVDPKEPPGQRRWMDAPEYQPYMAEWQKRPEYRPATKGQAKKAKKAGD